jgi:hypothetical protein
MKVPRAGGRVTIPRTQLTGVAAVARVAVLRPVHA